MIWAFIFDLDGTLIDTETLWVEALELYMRELGLSISHQESMDLVFGRAWLDIHRNLVHRFPGLAQLPIKRMQKEWRVAFMRLRQTRDVRIPGSLETLYRLAQEYPVCIVSGSSCDDLAEEVVNLGIDKTIRFYLGSEDYSPGKPDPACFRMAAARLGVAPRECLVFEDSSAGVRAAKSAGMHCVALVRAGSPAQDISGADLVVSTLEGFTPERLKEAMKRRVPSAE